MLINVVLPTALLFSSLFIDAHSHAYLFLHLLRTHGNVLCLSLYDIIAGNVRDMKVSKSEKMLATASADGTVRVWDIATDEVIHVLKLPRGKLYS